VLDGDAFSSAAQLEPKMSELRRLQIGQAEREAGLSEETLRLIGKYNDAVEAMSNSFVNFDLVLREAEERARKKPAAD
jgi:hypothetical protein